MFCYRNICLREALLFCLLFGFVYGIFAKLVFECLCQSGFIDLQNRTALLNICASLKHIRHKRNRMHYILNQFCSSDRVSFGLLQQKIGFVENEVLRIVLQKRLKLVSGVFSCKRIGIIAIGKKNRSHVKPLFQKQIDSFESRFDTCIVAIVQNGYVSRISFYQSNLRFCQGSSRRCHNITNSALIHHYGVHVALYQIAQVFFCYAFLCKVKSEEHSAL